MKALKALIAFCIQRWPLVALLSSALMLAIAHGFETFGKLLPCTLCLYAREVYWVAGTVALIALVVRLTKLGPKTARLFNLALGLIFLFGVGLAVYHAGVEWHFWPGPLKCSGGGGTGASVRDLNDLMNGGKAAAPSCDKAAWVFLGLSMAGWNALVSLKLAVWSFVAARKVRP